MDKKYFNEAIRIISEYHTTEIVINKSCDSQAYCDSDKPRLHIKNCCAGLINELVKAKFSLSLHDGFLSVDAYCK